MSKSASSPGSLARVAPSAPAARSRWRLPLAVSWRWFCRALRHASLLSLLIGTVYLILSLGGFWQQQMLVHSQRENLEQLSNEQMLSAMRELAKQGTAALPELVGAMGSRRASVAIAAHQVVLDELDRMNHLPARKAAQARLVLAQALAEQVTEFGPTTTRLAAYLAERLLREDFSAIAPADRASLIDACGEVMRYATRQVDLIHLAGSQDANWHETPRPLAWEQTLRLIAEEELAARKASAAKLENALAKSRAGGGIEPAGVSVPSLPDAARDANNMANTGMDLTAPRGLPDPRGERVPTRGSKPDNFQKPFRLRRLPGHSDQAKRRSDDNQDPSLALEQPDASTTLTPLESEARQHLPTRSQRGGASPNGPPRDETVIRLLQDLVAADEQAANRVATALGQRGISAQHLELAKRLADPDPAVRKSLVEVLPRTSGLNARPWLMWLARDENADVRLAAMRMLSTSQDFRLNAEIEALARGDHDPRIVALAEHLTARRRKER